MSSAKRYLAIALSFVLAVTVFAICVPRAVHAITATLVQIVNTPTNAVPTMHAPALSQVYQSMCVQHFNGQNFAACNLTPVPAGKILFVEAASVETSSDHGIAPYGGATIKGSSLGYLPATLIVPLLPQGSFGNLDLYAGTVGGRAAILGEQLSSVTVECSASLPAASSGGVVWCNVFGYLASMQ